MSRICVKVMDTESTTDVAIFGLQRTPSEVTVQSLQTFQTNVQTSLLISISLNHVRVILLEVEKAA